MKPLPQKIYDGTLDLESFLDLLALEISNPLNRVQFSDDSILHYLDDAIKTASFVRKSAHILMRESQKEVSNRP